MIREKRNHGNEFISQSEKEVAKFVDKFLEEPDEDSYVYDIMEVDKNIGNVMRNIRYVTSYGYEFVQYVPGRLFHKGYLIIRMKKEDKK